MKIFIRIVTNYFVLVAIFFSLMILSHMIPSNKLYNNVQASLDIIQKEGLKPKLGGIFFYRLDNFTDVLMLNTAVSVNSDSPVKSALLNKHYMFIGREYMDEATLKVLNSDFEQLSETNYSRYWHGYQSVLRPILCFIDYGGIRILNYICFSLILGVISYLIYKKSNKIFYSFVLSLLLINFFIVPLSIQFSIVFYISYLSMIFLLFNYKKANKSSWILSFFMTIGGLTSFFDLLTIPLVTLCFPLIIYLTCFQNNSKYRDLFRCSLYWGIGYASIWITKWLLVYFLLDSNILQDAINQVMFRTSNNYENFDMSIIGITSYLYKIILSRNLLVLFWISILFFILTPIIYFRYFSNMYKIRNNLYLLIIACMPLIWCLVLRNHSIIHAWFVWRLFVITIFSCCIFISFTYNKYCDYYK